MGPPTNIILYYVMLCYVMLCCYVTLRYVMLYIMLYHIMCVCVCVYVCVCVWRTLKKENLPDVISFLFIKVQIKTTASMHVSTVKVKYVQLLR